MNKRFSLLVALLAVAVLRSVPRSEGADLAGLDLRAWIQPSPVTARFEEPDYYVWCGTMARDDAGKCHLFYSRWKRHLGFYAWVSHSEIAHAVSDNPLGPYHAKDGYYTDQGGKGKSLVLFESPDGLKWKLAEHPFITTPEVTWVDGRHQKLAQLERPQIWLDHGVPAILFCAADETLKLSASFNLEIPLKMPGK